MTFPTVAATNTGAGDSNRTTSHTVNLPTSISSGDLLLIFISSTDTSPTYSASGWTFLSSDTNSTSILVALGYKSASGSEGSTLTLTSSASAKCCFTAYRITGWSGTPEKGTAATGTSASGDPPNLSPSWGADDTLWIAAIACASATAVSAAPTNYSNLKTNAGSGGTPPGIGTAERQLNASSENPGTFTNPNVAWVAQTFSIRPVAAGGGAAVPMRTLMGVGT